MRTTIPFWRIVVILGFLLVGPAWTGEGDGNQDDEAHRIISQFISEEFAGVLDARQRLAIFSAEREESVEGRLHPSYLSGVVISMSATPLVVVTEFEIKDTNVIGNRALVSVTFDQIGQTEGRGLPGRRLFATASVIDSVQYEMCRVKGRWLVFNPPIPRVSKVSLLSHYEGAVRSMEEVVKDPRVSQSQKEVYEALKKELDVIRMF